MDNNGANAQEPKTEERTFTQAELNAIVQKRIGEEKAKYENYEELKEKAQKFDEIAEANKTELQKAKEKADGLQVELDNIKKATALRDLRDEVSKTKGVPANLLTGATREECEAQADQILTFAKASPGYPAVPDGGEPTGSVKKATRDLFADWLNNGGN